MNSENRSDAGSLLPELGSAEVAQGVDRRAFMMRSTLVGAVAVDQRVLACDAAAASDRCRYRASTTPWQMDAINRTFHGPR
jgi:hypothetical protein